MNKKLLAILDQFSKKSILVIGDLMLDKYLWGDVTRISPEAPVQVVNVVKETFAPGGASNVATNVSALSGKVFMAGISGNDDARKILLNELGKRNINTDGILIDPDKPTTQKIRIMGKGQQLLRVDYENKTHLHDDIELSIMKFFDSIFSKVDVIVISDYSKGVITEKVSQKLIELSSRFNKPLIVDPKPGHKKLYRGATLITPNNSEASEMTEIEDGSDDSIISMGKMLMEDLDTNVLITRGEKGMSLFEKNSSITHIPANAREVYSIIGAGDTVVATLALSLACKADLKDAALLANIAAGIKVGKIGTASVSIDEIKNELSKS